MKTGIKFGFVEFFGGFGGELFGEGENWEIWIRGVWGKERIWGF